MKRIQQLIRLSLRGSITTEAISYFSPKQRDCYAVFLSPFVKTFSYFGVLSNDDPPWPPLLRGDALGGFNQESTERIVFSSSGLSRNHRKARDDNRYLIWALFYVILCNLFFAAHTALCFEHFITRQGDQLVDGSKKFRFVSFNIPNLHYVEDDMAFERTMSFRFPDEYELNDALGTIEQMGGQVVRTYTLSVVRKGETKETPKYVLGPGQFNEEAFRCLDRVLAAANRHNVRLIIPIVNNFQWWGGAEDYAAFRGKKKDDFWTDPQLIDDFKKTVRFLIDRVNTVTGVPYKEDKAILAWETGNETQCPHSWTHEICQYIKSLDSNHLVCDGFNTPVLRAESIDDELVDIVQTHHYENDARDMIAHIHESVAKAKGKKPYMLGEFGFIGTEGVRAVLDSTIEEGLSGALIWSLRHHYRGGGFFWHSEPAGGDFFKAYHWPGFDAGEIYDERNLMTLMREKAFTIQGKEVPPVPVPQPPNLLPIETVGAISWQGSVGARGYDVERAMTADGPWDVVGYNVSDAKVQYKPLFSDRSAEIGKSYYYRVRARNVSGVSEPGNAVGLVKVAFLTLVDEFDNESAIFSKSRGLSISRNEARRYKEDNHRLDGQAGNWILYRTDMPIVGFTVYCFYDDAESGLTFELSKDGRTFSPCQVDQKDFSSGEIEYGYKRPVKYSAMNLSGDAKYLKIEYKGAASLSRIEIDYGS